MILKMKSWKDEPKTWRRLGIFTKSNEELGQSRGLPYVLATTVAASCHEFGILSETLKETSWFVVALGVRKSGLLNWIARNGLRVLDKLEELHLRQVLEDGLIDWSMDWLIDGLVGFCILALRPRKRDFWRTWRSQAEADPQILGSSERCRGLCELEGKPHEDETHGDELEVEDVEGDVLAATKGAMLCRSAKYFNLQLSLQQFEQACANAEGVLRDRWAASWAQPWPLSSPVSWFAKIDFALDSRCRRSIWEWSNGDFKSFPELVAPSPTRHGLPVADSSQPAS